LESLKRPLRRLICRWEKNVKMDAKEMGWKDVVWILVADGRDR
jgi:hypothetical protein